MPNLYEILAEAQNGEAMAEIGRAYGLTQEQTEAAVAALLPAISMGLKRSTDTPEGLGNLLALMAQRPDLYAFYDDPRVAFSPEGFAAGNAALSQMFGSPEASRAIAAQAQNLSGVTSAILKKLLPVIVGMIISGLMRSGSGRAAPQAPQPAPAPAPEQGGGLIDILRQIFQQGQPEATGRPGAGSGSTPWGIPPIGDILGEPKKDVANTPQQVPQAPRPSDRPAPVPTDSGDDTTPGGDVLGQILRELEKGIREGRVKPVIVGPYEIDIPGTSKPSGPGQTQNSWRRYPRPDPARNARRQRRQTAIARPSIRFGFGGVRRSDRDRQGHRPESDRQPARGVRPLPRHPAALRCARSNSSPSRRAPRLRGPDWASPLETQKEITSLVSRNAACSNERSHAALAKLA